METTIVVSAVNLRKGGTLTILRDCLEVMSQLVRQQGFRVVALVHSKDLAFYPGIEYIELSWSVRSWLHRLWCEYVTMHGISKKIGQIDLWLSLHDTTPRVVARHQAVYCHNSYPFFRWQWHHLWQNYRIVCFALFTKFIYRINLHRNDFVIVQQEWFRETFRQMFGLAHHQIIVAPPRLPQSSQLPQSHKLKDGTFRFIYPAYPDVHKNFECLCEAARMLEQEVGRGRFEVLLTTDGTFNRYSRWLQKRWGNVDSLTFCGFLSREQLYTRYAQSDCLVFPSQVETWGLPISEFSVTGRPMLLADLPYAHESAAGSAQTAYFNPHEPEQLKELMFRLLHADFTMLHAVPTMPYKEPVAKDWNQLISKILTNENTTNR